MQKQSPTRHTVCARLPKELAKLLKNTAKKDSRNVSQMIQVILEAYFKK